MTIIVTIIWQLVEETTKYVLENYFIETRWEQTNFPLIFNQSVIKWVILCWQYSW